MTGETHPTTSNILRDTEREGLRHLVEHSLEWMAIEANNFNHADYNNLLYAMIDIRHRYSTQMPASTSLHLRRMIVLQTTLISDMTAKQDILVKSLRGSLVQEYNEFESFSEDLSDMPPVWQDALEDLALLVGNPDGQAIVIDGDEEENS
jgi:hypothetical protein